MQPGSRLFLGALSAFALILALPVPAQEVAVPPLMEFLGRAPVAVRARCDGPDAEFRFSLLETLKGEVGAKAFQIRVREANLSHNPDAADVDIEPGVEYLLFLKPLRKAGGDGLPVFVLFSATRGAIALRGAEGAALALTAKSLAVLNQVPVETREAAIRERFLALAVDVSRLTLPQGFELIELARVIDRFAMGTAEMARPLLALSGHAPPPLAGAILRVLTQIAGDSCLGANDLGLLTELALRDSLAPELPLRTQAVATMRLLPDARASARLEIMGSDDPDQAIRLAAQSALLDRSQRRVPAWALSVKAE